jgi:pyruvate kinase
MARTKIVATIGPASSKPETIRKLLLAGMNVARVNFSHGDHESHVTTVKTLREIAAAAGKVLAILGDLQGPKLRLDHIKTGGIQLAMGDEVVFTCHRGQPGMIHLPHPDLIEKLEPSARLIIGDGEVELVVSEKRQDAVRCRVTVPGLLEARKGVSAPGTTLAISSITEKDLQDLSLISQLDLDYVALSFVRSAADVHELRQWMAQNDMEKVPIIAKIEKSEAIDHLLEIRDAADGMMVARGDLGIEMPPQEVPLLQKRIIRCCNAVGKPVITATQMLQSMVEHPRPTRAEASDVANAILDGTDAVMLSQETAAGQYPVEAVLMMRQIAEMTEREFPYDIWRSRRQSDSSTAIDVTQAISVASCLAAEDIDARAIVSTTLSGYTARQVARHRPAVPVLAVSPLAATQRRLALVWGVECLLVPNLFKDTDDMLQQTAEVVRPYHFRAGEQIVITAGVPFGSSGQTNLIHVHEIS